ncbi:hypothetical protein AX774_g2153 [Zancudomyces culisetae]|uniref:Uncharacterized protein n=1 Tax=Zancudomyces culisetae TaxID=1213189 RepID=A0A1R1PTV3_ZANCU|nr:hypothetical protein AX774_g2153 [Zancudomyces culisetae]|eukprot:OMH84322.1 hypothetical protein AX774_g2153 [Zancudomyces culisetae]
MEQSTEHPKSVTKNGYSGLHSAEAPAVKDVINTVEDSNIPRRKILTKEDLDEFQKSKTFEELVGFIKKLNESVVGQKNPAEGELISKVTLLVVKTNRAKKKNNQVGINARKD